MAGQSKLFSDSLLAAADLSAKQYKFVKLTDDRTVNVCGNGEAMYGILQNDPAAAGRPAEVMVYGISNLVLGGTVTAGAYIGSDGNGDGVAVTADHAEYGAIAREGGDDNDVISVLLIPGAPTISA
ncbi:MAG: hypothetical protein WC934_07620 [Acidithiobacillus sp.]|jgi:hypothetical protein|uniref:hypothetical protein n=1 Tax=Acidithiobacillus sp. TaxID=1872118 RepID=UPI00355F758F